VGPPRQQPLCLGGIYQRIASLSLLLLDVPYTSLLPPQGFYVLDEGVDAYRVPSSDVRN